MLAAVRARARAVDPAALGWTPPLRPVALLPLVRVLVWTRDETARLRTGSHCLPPIVATFGNGPSVNLLDSRVETWFTRGMNETDQYAYAGDLRPGDVILKDGAERRIRSTHRTDRYITLTLVGGSDLRLAHAVRVDVVRFGDG